LPDSDESHGVAMIFIGKIGRLSMKE